MTEADIWVHSRKNVLVEVEFFEIGSFSGFDVTRMMTIRFLRVTSIESVWKMDEKLIVQFFELFKLLKIQKKSVAEMKLHRFQESETVKI